ncbi:iron complex transport system permease protein [Hoeflea marina]|uniref:Iron complex transport system permease protein n=2 Tax=Hoeflea marina TaxID=274592 RepID=A0A317PWK0_9HYPH|nr:iron complex transport system permease protein [Hoeflea marina]
MASFTLPALRRRSTAAAGDRSARARLTIGLLVLLLAATAAVCLAQGASEASLRAVMLGWAGIGDPASVKASDRLVIEAIRLPRVVLGMLIGAALAVSGALMQGLFRNPLADPGIVGVSGGAGLAAACAIVLGSGVLAPAMAVAGLFALPLAAFAGGLASTMLLYRIATRQGRTSVATMLLAGIAMAAFAGAGTGILVFMADDAQLRDLTFWNMGSLAGATWPKVISIAPPILLVLVSMRFLARGLNALALGEGPARHVGIPVERLKQTAIVAVALATGASVAVAGTIGFVGIVVPHLLRLSIGPDNRYLLPASALLGASLLLAADAVSRTIVAPAELPIGIVTAVIGAPFFLWILMRKRGMLDL